MVYLRDQLTFPIEGHRINILGFADEVTSIATIALNTVTVATDNTSTNGSGRVPINLYLYKQVED